MEIRVHRALKATQDQLALKVSKVKPVNKVI